MEVDYLIVGAGLTGAVIARRLADAGREVLVIDRRNHLGGNVHDFTHPSGVRVHTYGPHYFRTNSARIWDFVTSFAEFHPYEARVQTLVDGRHEHWPIGASAIRRHASDQWTPAFRGEPRNFEEASLAMMPREVYEKFVRGYTEKQWGAPAVELEPGLARRFDVRHDDDPRLTRHIHQGIPRDGYAPFMRGMLRGVDVRLDTDFREARHDLRAREVLVYTGPIDEFFDFRFGRLQYRGQRREHQHRAGVGFAQPCAQVNNPSPEHGAHVRTIEWKHLMAAHEAARVRGTVLTTETPFSPTDPGQYEYPFPDRANGALYAQYRALADDLPHTLICGRLGEYRYYDMDQAIGRAMTLVDRLLKNSRSDASIRSASYSRGTIGHAR